MKKAGARPKSVGSSRELFPRNMQLHCGHCSFRRCGVPLLMNRFIARSLAYKGSKNYKSSATTSKGITADKNILSILCSGARLTFFRSPGMEASADYRSVTEIGIDGKLADSLFFTDPYPELSPAVPSMSSPIRST